MLLSKPETQKKKACHIQGPLWCFNSFKDHAFSFFLVFFPLEIVQSNLIDSFFHTQCIPSINPLHPENPQSLYSFVILSIFSSYNGCRPSGVWSTMMPSTHFLESLFLIWSPPIRINSSRASAVMPRAIWHNATVTYWIVKRTNCRQPSWDDHQPKKNIKTSISRVHTEMTHLISIMRFFLKIYTPVVHDFGVGLY